MGDFSISWDVEGVDKTIKALLRGLNDGLEDSGNYLLRQGKEKAVDQVVGYRRIFTGEVVGSFETNQDDSIALQRGYVWRGSISNTSRHADVVDRGLAPAGEIEGANPSVQDIMPWVVANLSPADYDGGGGSPGFSPGPPYGGDGGISDDKAAVGNYRRLSDKGLSEVGMESNNPRFATMENGDEVIFKSRDGNNPGAVRNEVVWSRSQELAGFDNVGPRSRSDSTTIDGEEISGTIQEWVVDSDEFVDQVDTGGEYEPTAENPVSRLEFLQDNSEWLASTRALDYIHGNRDRHRGNIRFKNGEPRAIDNGGASFDDYADETMISLPGELTAYGRSDNPDELFQESLKTLDDLEDVFGDLADNIEYRKQIIEASEEVHGTDSKYHQRLVDVIGEDIGDGHFLSEDSNGVKLYQQHINKRRDILQHKYDTKDESIADQISNNEKDINEAINGIMDDISL